MSCLAHAAFSIVRWMCYASPTPDSDRMFRFQQHASFTHNLCGTHQGQAELLWQQSSSRTDNTRDTCSSSSTSTNNRPRIRLIKANGKFLLRWQTATGNSGATPEAAQPAAWAGPGRPSPPRGPSAAQHPVCGCTTSVSVTRLTRIGQTAINACASAFAVLGRRHRGSKAWDLRMAFSMKVFAWTESWRPCR